VDDAVEGRAEAGPVEQVHLKHGQALNRGTPQFHSWSKKEMILAGDGGDQEKKFERLRPLIESISQFQSIEHW
jgi:hypothetical protein